ncbi:Site-specific recombinase XerD [Mycolicibacterium fluoranthenivorans]|uniref:Site-specific recombinase XerD n=1 Tax=Mycolicibacterium fluoranthenivorans TaxID=258505 RepID=A0A1G4WQ01_9MYCO|nr:Site-specific recombinase XerD [Mycolicibacterium fluoranthenivorans]
MVNQSLPDLATLVPSWQLSLRSEGKSPRTLATYTAGVEQFLKWCERTGTPPEVTKANAQGWIADLLDSGAKATTAETWLGGIRRFTVWMVDEGELPNNPLLGMKPPKKETKVIDALSDDDIKLLIKACQGKSLKDRRDEAIVRLLVETGIRANEAIDLRCDDVDLQQGSVTVRRGKGGKGRSVPFGPQTATALDRYMRLRLRHAAPDNAQLFIGGHIPTFSYWGLARTLRLRAKDAGIEGFHLHKLRHTAATRWLRAGGSEGGLMAVAGWSSRSMMDRYVASSASERAAAEARSLNLGDL